MAITVSYGNNHFTFANTNMSTIASVINSAKGMFGDVFSNAVHRMKIIACGVDGGSKIDVTDSTHIRINDLFPNGNGKIVFSAR